MENIFDVLIVCALREEYDALVAVTDGIHRAWIENKVDGWLTSTSVFNCSEGVLSIQATWLGDIGREQALATAGQLISLRPSRSSAMCGICAGDPSKTSLGDVIFASSIWSYDAGKIVVINGESYFAAESHHYKPKPKLMQRYRAFKIDCSPWQSLRPKLTLEQQEAWYIRAKLASILEAEAFEENCPDWSLYVYNRLLKRGWITENGDLTDVGDKKALQLNVQYRNNPLPTKDFKVHVGAIATGAAVVEDDGIFTRLYNTVRGVRGIDMESSAIAALGAVTDKPVFIVKGISDYGDQFKDDRYREFAARSSAEALVKFLRYYPELFRNGNARRRNSGRSKLIQEIESKYVRD